MGCDPDNTRWGADIEFRAPECVRDCPEPDVVPPGYEKVGDHWQCAEGYTGTVVVDCPISSIFDAALGELFCSVEISMTGCLPIVPCRSPVHPDQLGCQWNASQCLQVEAGGSCTVSCRENYVGVTNTIECPEGNTNPNYEIDLYANLPECILDCPGPASEEYNRTGLLSWECSDGWFGDPVVSCKVDPYTCVLFGQEFSGCLPPRRCSVPEQPDERCSVDLTGCGIPPYSRLLPGLECGVHCAEPCFGESTTMVCPYDNVVPAFPLFGEIPRCVYSCDPVPAGYMKTKDGWRCAEGYAGVAKEGCYAGPVCENQLQLTGCLPIVPCVMPTDINFCIVNATECEASLQPGEECELTCLPPLFQGSNGSAFCPADNTDPEGPLMWTNPQCTPTMAVEQCGDPDPPPAAYASFP
jgi:hypothetical protein